MSDVVIRALQLGYSVNSRDILTSLDFEIRRGSFTVVVGENGSGKTTLLKVLMGLAKPNHGQLLINGKHPHLDPHADRQKIAYINEKMNPPIDWAVDDYLAFHRPFYRDYSTEIETILLREFRLKPESRMGNLSAGEVRRVQVIAALATSPEILFVDEITAVLDIVGRSKFMKALGDLQKRAQSTIVMATNIIDDVDTYATDVLLLHQGKLAKHSTREELTRGGQNLTDVLAKLIEESEKTRL